MARVKITAGRISEFSCTDGVQAFLWDTEAPGLAVRATQSGAKAYIHQGKLHGKSVRTTIGDVRAWSIEDARVHSRDLQTLMDKGIDPREQKRERAADSEKKKRDAIRKEAKFCDAWRDYLAANKKTWGERHYLDHVSLSASGGETKKRGKGLTAAGPLAAEGVRIFV